MSGRTIPTDFWRPDDRRAPEHDEKLSEWLERQQNPVRATAAGNAAILAQISVRGAR